jgi:hypothetical protein
MKKVAELAHKNFHRYLAQSGLSRMGVPSAVVDILYGFARGVVTRRTVRNYLGRKSWAK